MLDHRKSKGIPEKHLLLLHWLCQSLWPCRSQQTVENSSRDRNTRPPDMPPEKSVCRSRKRRGARDQVANIRWIIENSRRFQKNIYFCFINYVKAFDCVDHNKLWKVLKKIRIPDHLTCLLRNLDAGQEAIVRTGHGTTDWFQIGKGVHQGYILSSCLFNLYAE